MTDPPLRLLLVHTVLWSHYKAAVFSSVYELAREQGIDFKVIQIARNEIKRRDFDAIDYGMHRYPYELLFDDYLESIPVVRRVARVLRAIRTFRPDVLIIPGYSDPVCWAAFALSKVMGIRIACTMGSTELDRPRTPLKENVKSWLLRHIDGVFCYGTPQCQYLRKLGVSASKIMTRRQATDNTFIRKEFLRCRTEGFARADFPHRNFLYAGRLAEEKNLFALLDAFKACRSDWGLILVGGGPLEAELREYQRQNKIGRVFFVGPKRWDEVFRYFAHSSVFILPSTREPWGVVVNEAMLCELPVLVSSHCGCAPDLVDEGVNGFTFDPRNNGELQDLMQHCVDGDFDLEAMGEASCRIIESYTPECAARQLLEGVWSISGRNPLPALIPENV